jgi:hypothetical protein
VISVQPQNARYQTTTASPSSLSVKASSPDGGVLSYQWYSNTMPYNSGGSPISGAKGSTYTPSANNYAVNYYYVVVTNTNNNVSGVKMASVVSRVAEVAVGTKVSFYDANLDFNASIGVDTSSPATIDIAQLKIDLGLSATQLFEANKTTDQISNSSYSITGDINFYAVQNVQEITTQAELAAIGTGNYMLLNDIALDESGAGFDSASGWQPIYGFVGILNGNGHKITGLWTDRTDYASLFAQVYGVQIKNLGVEIPNGKELIGRDFVGGIAGFAKDSTITNCYVTGDIRATSAFIGYVGGIVGEARDSNITNVYTTGNISGYQSVGGIVGRVSYSGDITNSYSTGNIIGYGGGVGGIAGSTDGAITNSYSTGNIIGYSGGVGGIAGGTQGDINNSYATGDVSGYGSNVGGITGSTYGDINNSYATGNISGYRYVGGIAGGAYGDIITNSYATGDVSGYDSYIGGIAGSASKPIANSYATGDVSGNEGVGGIAGGATDVTNSYATGNISGYRNVGGIAGGATDVTNSYATGNISGTSNVGGIAGSAYGDITNNAAINPSVSASVSDVNKIVGYINGSPTINNNFALSTMTITPNGSSGNGGDADKTIVELKTQSTYTGLGWLFGSDDSNPWKIDANKNGGLPYLYYQDQ